jgi:hypothetical protein
LCRIRDQRAVRRSHLGQTTIGGAQPPGAERIVATGVEDHEVEARAGSLHLPRHKADVHHLEIDVGLARRIGANRHQIIGAADLHAVAGVIEKRDIGALNPLAKILHGLIHRGLVKIELSATTNQDKTQAGKGVGHQPRVLARIVERGDISVGRVADYERYAFLGRRRRH